MGKVTVQARLKPYPARSTGTVNPTVTVYIGGTEVGIVPCLSPNYSGVNQTSFEVSPGKHKIQAVVFPNYKTQNLDFEVQSGEEILLECQGNKSSELLRFLGLVSMPVGLLFEFNVYPHLPSIRGPFWSAACIILGPIFIGPLLLILYNFFKPGLIYCLKKVDGAS